MKRMTTKVVGSVITDSSNIRVRRGRANLAIFLAAFATLLVLKYPNLDEVPVWDGAMSVFPAAITLAETGFDLPSLLEAPTYAAGGPNVHALSLITWITAAVLMGGGGLVLLHILHLLIGAGANVAVFRLAEVSLGKRLAIPATAASMLSPLVLTQMGFLYLEVGLTLATVMAMLAWSRNRPGPATIWAVVAVLVKTSGIIVAGGLLLADLLGRDGNRRSPARAAFRFGVAALVFFLKVAWSSESAIGGSFGPQRGLQVMGGFLLEIPDLALLIVTFLVVTLLAATTRKPVLDGPRLAIGSVVVSFFGFYLLFSALGGSTLPRYWVQIVPLVIIGLAAALRRWVPAKAVFALLLVLASFFVVNRNGLVYRDVSNNNFAVAERSGEYRDLLALHQQGSAFLEDVGQTRDVFYSLPYHYFVSYPTMRYVTAVPLLGHSILHERPFSEQNLNDFPSCFTMLYEFSWLGGGIIKSVWDQADADPSRVVTVTSLQSGKYRAVVIEVDTTDELD